MSLYKLVAGVAGLALAPVLQAEFVVVDRLGGAVEMHAGPMPGLPVPGSFSLEEAEMELIHQDLNSSGVDTDGRVTFVLGNTSVGLTFLTLIDSNIVGPPTGSPDAGLAVSSTTTSAVTRYVNAEGGDQTAWSNLGNGLQIFGALYSWDSGSEGDGFAWGGLLAGDTASFHFDRLTTAGLNTSDPFQFVSYDQGDWTVIDTANFTSRNQYVFSFQTVIPAPGAVAMLVAAGLALPRRRRR